MSEMRRVLFLDDEAAIVEAFTIAAEFAGVQVEGFTRAAAALERFRSDPLSFRAVITDFTMADMACADFLSGIRGISPGIGVYLCTGNAEHEIEEAARNMSVAKVLYKPFDYLGLEAFLREILPPGE
jgi:two-component system cell cycle sensor histidine kinase/response regulator CckA